MEFFEETAFYGTIYLEKQLHKYEFSSKQKEGEGGGLKKLLNFWMNFLL